MLYASKSCTSYLSMVTNLSCRQLVLQRLSQAGFLVKTSGIELGTSGTDLDACH